MLVVWTQASGPVGTARTPCDDASRVPDQFKSHVTRSCPPSGSADGDFLPARPLSRQSVPRPRRRLCSRHMSNPRSLHRLMVTGCYMIHSIDGISICTQRVAVPRDSADGMTLRTVGRGCMNRLADRFSCISLVAVEARGRAAGSMTVASLAVLGQVVEVPACRMRASSYVICTPGPRRPQDERRGGPYATVALPAQFRIETADGSGCTSGMRAPDDLGVAA